MEELFKSLSESVSEECFNDIMGIVEEIINEVNVPDETVVKILDRKTGQVAANQAKRGYHMQLMNNTTQNKTSWHNDHPDADSKDRWDYQYKHMKKAQDTENQGINIKKGAERLGKWVRKKYPQSAPAKVVNSYNRLGDTVKRSNRENKYNPIII